jgi:transglutaminase-like putative cysteine protease
VTGADRLSLASALAALAAGVALVPLTEDRSYLVMALLLTLLSVGIGTVMRRAHAGEVTVRLVQLAPVLLVPWLVPALRDPLDLYVETYSYIQTAFAPMPYQAGFAVFTAVLVWLVYLLTETLVIGLASPAWTFPVLIMPYIVPSLAIYSETSPFLFCFPAAGFALILATATATSVSAGGADEAAASGWRRGVATTATLATVLAFVGTLVLSLPIPERSGNGPDTGGSGSVQLGDPSLDLIRNINSSSNQTLLTYRSSDGAGEYLRLAALPVFDARGFHLTATDLVPLQFQADRPGAAEQGTVRTSVQVGALAGEYLPMPWFPIAADVPTDAWRYDPKTLAVVAIGTGRNTATRNLSYDTSSARLPAAETLLPSLTTAGDPGDGGLTLQLPDALSDDVRRLAEDVTRGKGSAGAKALALADFLRSDAFTYSTAVSPGTTLGTLDDFLLGSRTGYCEQFAGSLAVMARVVGIPSRVVVGFLPGKKTGDHWEVSARNMHAWTELYFGGSVGWLPVDPTPSGAVGNGTPATSAAPTHSATTKEPSAPASSAAPTLAPLPTDGTAGGPSNPLPWLVGTAGLLVVVAAGPRLARVLLRSYRLAGSADARRAAEHAWAEVRAVVRDRGRDWPSGTSRQVATELGEHLDPVGRRELTELAMTVERARYDQEPVSSEGLAARVERITAAMEARWGRPPSKLWWPRSLRPAKSS